MHKEIIGKLVAGVSHVQNIKKAAENKSFPMRVTFSNIGPVPIILPRYRLHAPKGQKTSTVFNSISDLLACVADLAQIAESLSCDLTELELGEEGKPEFKQGGKSAGGGTVTNGATPGADTADKGKAGAQ